ncbi:PREDICTED: developmental pluripotency-associated protein 2-like [Elephantulus edwardii]|uniref:developmental pluripotency-associated protein 2-like n=1 Tax=Elephantulus edwardii TaxID=28737 RepID=UPI0003F09699|nr:PREDICTED: developmental pluripotency-associated protein 2-like [Elephantulus edwardii]
MHLVEESPTITLSLATEEYTETVQTAPSVPPMADVKVKKPRNRSKVPSETNEQVKPRQTTSNGKMTHIPMPDVLPPITEVHRNTLRYWCQLINLSSGGQKSDLYLRVQTNAYPDQKYLPVTPREAKMKKSSTKGPRLQESSNTMETQERTYVAEVVTSAEEAIMATWTRISSRAAQPKAVNSCRIPPAAETFLPKVIGGRWCVVHGRVLPSDVDGWVRLQFHSGHVWVPDSPRKMISLLILPACVFPSPEIEDNMLCPQCVQRNKKLLKRLLALGKTKKPNVNTATSLSLKRLPVHEVRMALENRRRLTFSSQF